MNAEQCPYDTHTCARNPVFIEGSHFCGFCGIQVYQGIAQKPDNKPNDVMGGLETGSIHVIDKFYCW